MEQKDKEDMRFAYQVVSASFNAWMQRIMILFAVVVIILAYMLLFSPVIYILILILLFASFSMGLISLIFLSEDIKVEKLMEGNIYEMIRDVKGTIKLLREFFIVMCLPLTVAVLLMIAWY